MVLRASHSHLFPGARVRTESVAALPANPVDVLVVFVDDSSAEARLSSAGDNQLLGVDSYRTTGGTDVQARSWLITIEPGASDDLTFKVIDRAG